MNRTAVCFVKIIFDFIFPESEEPHFLISGKKINVCNIELWNNIERNFAHSVNYMRDWLRDFKNIVPEFQL